MELDGNEEKDERTREILEYYRGLQGRSSQETIVDMLRELQEVNGCISPSIRDMAAEAAGVKTSTMQAILKRYPSLKQASYTHEIVLCAGKNCAAKGSLLILRQLKEKLGIKENGISRDGTICLKTRSCLKHCPTAPNVMVDGQYVSCKDAEQIIGLLQKPSGRSGS